MNKTVVAPVAAILAGLAGPALAHTGHGAANGFAAGFGHPLGGLDHALAMIAVGLLGAQLGGRAIWLVPAAFVAAMTLGGMVALDGSASPLVETGIAGSVIVLGAVVALGRRIPVSAAMALAGAFALFHGHAHGSEMPAGVSGVDYALGFVVATILLHMLGIGLGLGARMFADRPGSTLIRLGGGAIGVAGAAALLP